MISGEGKSYLGSWRPPTADPENIDHPKKDELEKPEEKSSFLHVGLFISYTES
jgi:hypothetical protein